MSDATILELRDLTKEYRARRFLPGRGTTVRALDGITLDIRRGEIFGLVGESGSGKSTLGRVLLGLVPATSGSIRFEGQDLGTATRREMRLLRRRLQIVFQDPYSSLNPRLRIGQALGEAVRAGGGRDPASRIPALLDSVGLAATHARAYPHELSGGQRQRVAIARALAVDPSFIVADEPVSALDLSIQAQILNLLADLRQARGLTYLFISHDLAVVRYLADRIAVMYRGRIVEQAPAKTLFAAPRHPYTQLLLSSEPEIAPSPGFGAVETGCRFLARCPIARDICRGAQPPLAAIDAEHRVACFVASGAA